jgi:TonB family protein
MDQIEPDDIKSVNILRANSATEKYGQLAKNGAMEIQTKGKVNLAMKNGNVVVEVNEYADNQKMDLHNNNIIDEMPEFKSGMKGLMKFISGNIKYPDQAQANKAQGNVEVNFVIDRNGKVENVSIANAVDTSLEAEAIRVISSMPDWNPGMQSGQPVAVSFTIPIQFSIK